ncbi:MAG: hypothetical protein R3D00_04060 [Bacteroidia bacterium]
MMSEQETYNLIEKYLSNELSPGEAAAFEARCKADQTFANEVILHTLAREEIHATSMAQLKARLDARFTQTKQTHIVDMRRTRLQWTMSIAAAILLLFLGVRFLPGILSPSYSSDQLYAMNFNVPELHDDTVRGTNTDSGDSAASSANALWAQAIQAINEGKPAEAVSLYQQLMQDSAQMQRSPSALNYQMGIALMLSDRHAEAIPYFDQVKAFDQKQMADWYKALAYLKTNQLTEARALLEALSNDQEQTEDRRKQAGEILEKIERIQE